MIKNITLSADDSLIKKAREKAQRERTTLNDQFRLWLNRYVASEQRANEYDQLMKELKYTDPGRTFSREEFNER